jgi:hypothetical protein
MERGTANYLMVAIDDRIDRQVKTGSKDVGDVGGLRFLGHKIAIECKEVVTPALPAWLREAEVERQNLGALAGVVVHRLRGNTAMQDQIVSMRLRDFASLMAGRRIEDLPDIRFGQKMPAPTLGQEEE